MIAGHGVKISALKDHYLELVQDVVFCTIMGLINVIIKKKNRIPYYREGYEQAQDVENDRPTKSKLSQQHEACFYEGLR